MLARPSRVETPPLGGNGRRGYSRVADHLSFRRFCGIIASCFDRDETQDSVVQNQAAVRSGAGL